MTAGHAADERPLRIVPADQDDPADAVAPIESGDEWRGEAVAAQWEPESQLIGALMWLPAARVRPILEIVPDTAIWGPMNRWAYEIIRALVDDGRNPDPVTVLARAKHHAAGDALHTDRPPTPGQHHRLALHLADLYTHTVSPAGATSYARDVLDEAYRRAFREHGIRMQQLGECGADRADLTEQFAVVREVLADLWRRAETAAQPGWGNA